MMLGKETVVMVGTRVIMGAEVISVFVQKHSYVAKKPQKGSTGQYFKGVKSYYLVNRFGCMTEIQQKMDGIGEIISLHIRSTL